VRHKRYFYGLLARYIGYYLPGSARVVEVMPRSALLREQLARPMDVVPAGETGVADAAAFEPLEARPPDRVVLNGCLHFVEDLQPFFEQLRRICRPETRLVVTYYGAAWKPLFRLASRAGLVDTGGGENWLSPHDVTNLLALAGFEVIAHNQRVLLPVWIPLVSAFVNRWLAPLPFFRLFTLVNVLVARPVRPPDDPPPSVTVVVPARNERGNIQALVDRLPAMGPSDELIFVEGHSSDGTWEEIQRVVASHPGRRMRCLQQRGRGKGDAVRLGFAEATCDVLMILDADLSVPPEVLPRFHRALADGVGDFVNGSRLVYPMEEKAMRFANLLGNKFFAAAFSFLLGQPLKDTLCGTKVLRRSDYEAIAREREYFGDFDPFGDFDLLFGASRQTLKIVEIPVRYRERVYGETNIQRWSHGWLLLRMTLFAARRLKFI
jgi:SAM-dependent methyltransferase